MVLVHLPQRTGKLFSTNSNYPPQGITIGIPPPPVENLEAFDDGIDIGNVTFDDGIDTGLVDVVDA